MGKYGNLSFCLFRLPLEKAKNYLHVQVYGYLIPSEKSNEREILDSGTGSDGNADATLMMVSSTF